MNTLRLTQLKAIKDQQLYFVKKIDYLERLGRHEVERPQLVVFGYVGFIPIDLWSNAKVDELDRSGDNKEICWL